MPETVRLTTTHVPLHLKQPPINMKTISFDFYKNIPLLAISFFPFSYPFLTFHYQITIIYLLTFFYISPLLLSIITFPTAQLWTS
jgi:hypothetical protein